MTAATTIRIGEDYDVIVGRDLLAEVSALVPPRAERALVVHPEALSGYADVVESALVDAGFQVHRAQVPDAESAKSVATAAELWDRLGSAAFTRTDVLVAVGGGTVTDLVGFVAATWLRGVAVLHVPTTVLAMVDAAVGGKTGINTRAGKNLVGSFHSPHGVLCDLVTLETLPLEDVRAGLAEVVKGGFIADPRILELIEIDPSACQDVGGPVVRELIERKIRVKARIVAEDLTEAWLRETLNYGHTLGHAIEQAEGYRLRHGEAVGVGMVFAAELAQAAGLIDADLVARHRSVLGSLGLPVTDLWGAGVDDRFAQLLDVMRRDKKSRGSLLRFVVLDGLASVTRLEGPPEDLLRTAYLRISASV